MLTPAGRNIDHTPSKLYFEHLKSVDLVLCSTITSFLVISNNFAYNFLLFCGKNAFFSPLQRSEENALLWIADLIPATDLELIQLK